jgi:hypothetical protein
VGLVGSRAEILARTGGKPVRSLSMSFGGMFDGAGSGVFSYDATGGGTGMHNPGRLVPAPPLPKPGGFGATGLSLGLVRTRYTPCAGSVADFPVCSYV